MIQNKNVTITKKAVRIIVQVLEHAIIIMEFVLVILVVLNVLIVVMMVLEHAHVPIMIIVQVIVTAPVIQFQCSRSLILDSLYGVVNAI